jgi:hypothetical protein
MQLVKPYILRTSLNLLNIAEHAVRITFESAKVLLKSEIRLPAIKCMSATASR